MGAKVFLLGARRNGRPFVYTIAAIVYGQRASLGPDLMGAARQPEPGALISFRAKFGRT